MSNDVGPSAPAFVMPPPPLGYASIAWSEAQLQRLGAEYQGVLRNFAYHPFVAVSVVAGEPPTRYRVDYRVHTLIVNANEELEYADVAVVEVWMSPGFPSQPPLVRPLLQVFHPNVAMDSIALPGWEANHTLADVVRRIGDYLAWRSYDPSNIINELAANWLSDNGSLLPLDAVGDFTPNAGGEPLGRISRYGPVSIEQVGKAFEGFLAALTGETGLSAIQIQAFAVHTRNTLRLLLAGDLPASILEPANRFDRWATELQSQAAVWDLARRCRAAARQVMKVAGELVDSAAPLRQEMEAMAGLVPQKFGRASEAVRLLPSGQSMEPFRFRLPELIKAVETATEALRSQLSAMSSLPALPSATLTDSDLGQKLGGHLKEVGDQVAFALRSGQETLTAIEPAIATARAELAGLCSLASWREYIDSFHSAALVEQQLQKLGSDGLGAFFIKNAGGRYGPFQLEQEVDLGTAKIVVRSGQPGELELIDAATEMTLGRSAEGKLTVKLSGGDAPPVITQFTLAEGLEQPAVQLDYASKQTTSLIAQLRAATAPGAVSWVGRMLQIFSEPSALTAAHVEHRKAVHRWSRVLIDLKRLSEFKARLMTYHLATHASEAIPRLFSSRQSAERNLEQGGKRLSAIAARGTRHIESGELIIPPKLVPAYAAEQNTVDLAEREKRRIDSVIRSLGARLKARLSSTRLCGRPEVPRVRQIPPLSPELAAFEAEMSDKQLKTLVESLSALLGTALPINIKPPPAGAVPPPPIAPPEQTSKAQLSVPAGAEEAVDVSEAEPPPDVPLIAGHEPDVYATDDILEELPEEAVELEEAPFAEDDIEMSDERST